MSAAQEFIRFKPRQKGDFYEAVCQRAHAWMEANGKDKYATPIIWVKALFYGGLMMASYAAILMKLLPPVGLVLLAILHGLALLGFLLNVAHDAAHGALTRTGWVNHVIFQLTLNLVGINGYLWKRRHLNSHHIFPNINGCDTDIDNNLILRFSPNAPYKPWFRFQHLYAPFVYLIVQVHAVYMKDFLHIQKKDLANMHNITHPWHEYLFFALGKLLHIGVYLVIPAVVMQLPFWQIVLGYVLMSFVNSVLFVIFFAGTHFADECIFPVRPENGTISLTYAEHAMLASLDWNAKSHLWHFLVGGINAHAAHHLFPHICHAHYMPLTDIIKDTAREFGLQYNEGTLVGMVRSHFRLLKKLSVPNEEFTETQRQLIFQPAA